MRRLVLIGMLFLPLLAVCQRATFVSSNSAKLTRYIRLYSATDQQVISSPEVIPMFANSMADKRSNFRKDKNFLKHLFKKTHQQFLTEFKEYASFSDLLNEGKYNCLTGTALYAVLLQHFEIPYQIIETNYHIFLMAETSQGRVLLEATDPVHGFIDRASEIEKRITKYQQNVVQRTDTDKRYYQFSFDMYGAVNLDQMLGLLYYNQAIKAYNQHHWIESVAALDKAYALYKSPRMEVLSQIVLESVADSKLDETIKRHCLKKIRLMRQRTSDVVASIN